MTGGSRSFGGGIFTALPSAGTRPTPETGVRGDTCVGADGNRDPMGIVSKVKVVIRPRGSVTFVR